MREISPAVNLSCEELLAIAPNTKPKVGQIRAQKLAGIRILPSSSIEDLSSVLDTTLRAALLDRVATLVDENLFGRSEMCQQFALLLGRALVYKGLPAKVVAGEAVYYNKGLKVFSWRHAWVCVETEAIDGNVDSLWENPAVPSNVRCRPYWGPIKQIPVDRKLRRDHTATVPADPDVEAFWWPELEQWLHENTS